MSIRRGIFLTEVLVFLFLFSLFSVAVMSFIARSTISLMKLNKKNDHIATLSSTIDWLMRDIQTIDNFYTKVSAQEGVLRISSDKERVTWKMNNNAKLLRVSQRYDSTLNQWKKHYTSIVVQGISDLYFELLHCTKKTTGNTTVSGVRCAFSTHIGESQISMDHTIALRNGDHEA